MSPVIDMLPLKYTIEGRISFTTFKAAHQMTTLNNTYGQSDGIGS
jgi:hypothetical protein